MKVTDSHKLSPVIFALCFSAGWTTARAAEFFNPALLERQEADKEKVDLSAFENGEQVPGIYRVDLLINTEFIETRSVKFDLFPDGKGGQSLQPCLSLDDLEKYGVRVEQFPELVSGGQCTNLSTIPDASAIFIFSSQKLALSIPQAALNLQARGYVAPALWDEGLTALMLNYNFTGAQNYARHGVTQDSRSQYLNLRPGLNMGPWRVRNYMIWNRDSNGKPGWDRVYTYVQRNVIALRAQLTLGESNSPSDIYDSVPFRGAQLASDDEMLPDSLKSYAPVVRGIARTNAQVIIRQNGYIIYQNYVAPGAFTISDMYPTGGSGDLDVIIKEADGSEQHMIEPFASVPILQREGRFKYSITSGQYRAYNNSIERTPFTQATGILGIPYGLTIYGGTQQASIYQSMATGVGKNLGVFGAFSVDVTQSWAKPKEKIKDSGQSWRARYSKNFVDTGTNFAIAGYRYSTRGFYTLNEVLDSYNRNGSDWLDRRRNRAELTVSQNLWEGAGALTLSMLSENYWNKNRRMRSVGVGYNNSWNGMSYGISYNYNHNSINVSYDAGKNDSGRVYEKDQIMAFNISIPLDRFIGKTWVNYSLNTTRDGSTSNTVGMNGNLLEGNNLNWNIQQGRTNHGGGIVGNMAADYQGTYGALTGGYARSKNAQRLNYGVQGGVMLHENGLTLSQTLGETVALVKAPGVKGAAVGNETGVNTDFRGYTVVPYIGAYRRNVVTLDPESLAENVDLETTSQTVIPTRGAVVRANFSGRTGQRLLLKLTRTNNLPVPFGATVTAIQGEDFYGSIVGDKGQVYLSGLRGQGEIEVSWGNRPESQCSVSYNLPKENIGGVQQLNALCRPAVK